MLAGAAESWGDRSKAPGIFASDVDRRGGDLWSPAYPAIQALRRAVAGCPDLSSARRPGGAIRCHLVVLVWPAPPGRPCDGRRRSQRNYRPSRQVSRADYGRAGGDWILQVGLRTAVISLLCCPALSHVSLPS